MLPQLDYKNVSLVWNVLNSRLVSGSYFYIYWPVSLFADNLWSAKSWLIGKDPDAGRDWGQEEKGTTEDEMAGWHHRLNGRESGWTPGVGDGQGGLACCNTWGRKESDTTVRLNWTKLNWDTIRKESLQEVKILCFPKSSLFLRVLRSSQPEAISPAPHPAPRGYSAMSGDIFHYQNGRDSAGLWWVETGYC